MDRFDKLVIILIVLFLVMAIKLINVQIFKHSYYLNKYEILSNVIVEGETPPRGKILDRNGNIIVDNKPVRVLVYKKKGNVDEIALAYNLSKIIDINYNKISLDAMKVFLIKQNKINNLLTKKDKIDLEYRKTSQKELEEKMKTKINKEKLDSMSELDKKAAYIYYLMHNNYSYLDKVIKKDLTEEEMSKIISSHLNQFSIKIQWERNYIYGNVFREILGNIAPIPKELKEEYIKKGYNLNDKVGISYLEYQYDDYLKGKKDKYKLKNNKLELIEKGNKGKDIKLTLDIKLQKEVENIIEEEMVKSKKEPNTEFFNKAFVIISNPKTGEILAMSGKQIVENNGEYKFLDYTPGVFTSSYAVGSVVKGASHIVGYNTGSLKIGELRNDTCVKLKNAPIKCSWKYLGQLDDITALKMSSNTFQFYTAFKVANKKYYYDMPFNIDNDAFNIYRKTFNEFGLGVKSGIDLPNESEGLKGNNDKAGLLLDFAIGQYDNYTPLQLAQYINTIANNGSRMKIHLLKNKNVELNKLNTEQKYLDRIKEGFKQVLGYGGTGSGYIDLKYNPSGKTGTSQSFVDSDKNGVIDTETVTNTFIAYAPYNDPKVTFTVVTPDTYNYGSTYQTSVNRRISKKISEKYFEFYN